MLVSLKSAPEARPVAAAPSPSVPPIEGPDIRMVALGDSLTAGTQDGTTMQDRQVHCYAQQLADHAHLEFNEPLLDKEGIPFGIFHDHHFDLDHFHKHVFWLSLVMAPLGIYTYYIGAPPVVLPAWNLIKDMGNRVPSSRNTPEHPQGNFAVSGYELRHLYNTANVKDYLREIHSGVDPTNDIAAEIPLIRATLGNGTNNGVGSAVDQALQENPDLVICWAGNNDALAAVFGGVIDDRVLTPVDDRKWQFWENNPITGNRYWRETKDVIPGFRSQVLGSDGLMQRLLSGSQAEIVLCNLPDVTVIPLLREVGKPVGKLPFRIQLQDGQDVTQQVEQWVIPDQIKGEGHNGRTTFPAGSRVSLVTMLTHLTDSGGPTSPADLQARLAALSQGGFFTEDDVLDPDELATVSGRIKDFNQVLQDAGSLSPRVHVIDVNSLLNDALLHGRPLRGPGPDEWIVPGFTGAPDAQGRDGIFSYDGVHPSDTGHAVIANIILDRLRADLGDQDRFRRFKNLPPLDEKAVHHGDPHTTSTTRGILLLDKEHVDQWAKSERF